MRTLLLYGALGLLGMAPVWLVLSVWTGEGPPTTTVATLGPEEQAQRELEARRFAINRDGCELALGQVNAEVKRRQPKATIALDRCQVDVATLPAQHLARGRAKFLGALQWDPPIDFRVWFIPAEDGRFVACAMAMGGGPRKPVRSPHHTCPDWRVEG